MPTKIPDKEDLPLPKPEQITIAWLKQHVPLSWWRILWASLIPVFSFVFVLGVVAGNWEPISAWVIKTLDRHVSSLSLQDHLREIRDIVNCRIDLSSKFEVDNFRSPQKAARAQRILESNVMIKELLDELNRITFQVEQFASTRDIGRNFSPVSPDELHRCLKTVDTK